jgi:chorismate mutase
MGSESMNVGRFIQTLDRRVVDSRRQLRTELTNRSMNPSVSPLSAAEMEQLEMFRKVALGIDAQLADTTLYREALMRFIELFKAQGNAVAAAHTEDVLRDLLQNYATPAVMSLKPTP